jgi:hypothetical protein
MFPKTTSPPDYYWNEVRSGIFMNQTRQPPNFYNKSLIPHYEYMLDIKGVMNVKRES